MNTFTFGRSAATVVLAAAAAAAHAQTCVPLEVHNLLPERGTLMVAAYASADEFGKKSVAALQLRSGSATTAAVSICLHTTAAAVALTIYQDLNDNGKLDANVLGIPSEPWGASGRAPGFGAPTWASAQVPLDGSAIVVKLSK